MASIGYSAKRCRRGSESSVSSDDSAKWQKTDTRFVDAERPFRLFWNKERTKPEKVTAIVEALMQMQIEALKLLEKAYEELSLLDRMNVDSAFSYGHEVLQCEEFVRQHISDEEKDKLMQSIKTSHGFISELMPEDEKQKTIEQVERILPM